MDVKYFTLQEIVTEAASLGYGKPNALKHRFNKYRIYGLVGEPVGKETRQGGAGLWNVMQKELFIFYTIQAKKNISTVTLSNVPVGYWLMRFPGISLRQVQRAFEYGIRETIRSVNENLDRRSRHQKNIDAGINKLVKKDTKRTRKKSIRTKVENLIQDPYPTSRISFVNELTAVMNHEKEFADALSDTTLQTLSNRALAIRHRKVLTSEKSVEFWIWARDSWSENMNSYQKHIGQYQVKSNIFTQPSFNEILTNSIAELLPLFGHGIRMLQSGKSATLPIPIYPKLQSLFEE